MRIGEMIAYQSYNTKSPLNGEAARWVDDHADDLPLDPVSLFPEEKRPAPAAPKVNHTAPAKTAAAKARPQPTAMRATTEDGPRIRLVCPGCGTQYKLAANVGAKRVRCKKCQTIIDVPAKPAGA
jgi:predicted Zn finger-like uncharacterized protein